MKKPCTSHKSGDKMPIEKWMKQENKRVSEKNTKKK